MMDDIKAFKKTFDQTHEWINDLTETYMFADKEKAFVLLRATLKTLRDRIPSDEAFHLASQLPALLRGFYFEGWDPHKNPKRDRTIESFLLTVRYHLGGHDDIELETAVPIVLKVIFQKIDPGEAEDVINNLPKEVQAWIP